MGTVSSSRLVRHARLRTGTVQKACNIPSILSNRLAVESAKEPIQSPHIYSKSDLRVFDIQVLDWPFVSAEFPISFQTPIKCPTMVFEEFVSVIKCGELLFLAQSIAVVFFHGE